MKGPRELFRRQALELVQAPVRRDRPLVLTRARRELAVLALVLVVAAIALAWAAVGAG